MSNNLPQDQTTFFVRSGSRKSCQFLRNRALAFLFVLSLFGASVCAQSSAGGGLDRFKKEAKEVSKPAGQPANSRAKPGAQAANAWVIVVGAFTGDEQARRADEASKKLILQGGLTGVTTQKRGKATVLEYGTYSGPDDPKAQEDLARLAEISIDGQTPLVDAFLAPPENAPAGSLPEFDLRNALKNTKGKSKPIYTLQVGVYTRDDDKAPNDKELAEFRKTAEEAAAQLRREGEVAFYYHGPNRSMVTVGLFGPKDSDPLKPGSESMALRELRDRYKYNLLNGKGIRETRKGIDGKDSSSLQPSFLVMIPQN